MSFVKLSRILRRDELLRQHFAQNNTNNTPNNNNVDYTMCNELAWMIT